MKELIEKEKTSSANKNTDPPGEENERKAKYDNLLKDFCNILKEKATISAKIEATETIKDQIPKGSYLFDEFNDYLVQRDRLEMNTANLCAKLKELDINFNEEEHMKDECNDIKGQEFVSFMGKIIKLIEGNAESGDASSTAGNRDEENPTKTSYERFDGLVPVILSIPDSSSKFRLPQDIIENVQSSSISIMNE